MRDYHFQPGNTESTGRPPGSPNKRTNELRYRLQNRGDVDPADFCSAIVSNPNEPTELKLAAANYLLPYLYPKRGAVATPRYIDEPIQLPEPTTIEQANKNIAYISSLKAQGLIDLDFANSLIADNTTIANNLIAEEELKFKLYPPETRDTTITVVGGLPALPGTNITMPVLNGHAVSEQLLSAPTDVIPADDGTNQVPETTATELLPTPGELKAQGPHPLQEHHFAPSSDEPDEPRTNSTNGGQEPCP
jgi:hypothetical protein